MGYVFIGFLLAAGIVIGSILGWVANSRVGKLETEVRKLRALIGTGAGLEAVKTPTKPSQTGKPKAPTKPQAPIAPNKPDPVRAAALNAPPPKTKKSPKSYPAKQTPKKAKSKKPKRSFEEEIGARWAVWVGGVTLLLGAVFLLHYAAQAGFFTPAMRVGLAALLGMTSIGAGEFLRRKDAAFFKGRLGMDDVEKTAYIPGVLTGVGIFALYGAAYAAHALYGLILPLTAFAAMAIVSMIAFGLSLIQGPRIAALGLVGSLITPMLISASPPNFPMLFSYLAIVTAMSIILSRFKNWAWLSVAALFGALFWMMRTVPAAKIDIAFWPWAIFAFAIFCAALWLASKDKDRSSLLDISVNPGQFISSTAFVWFLLWGLTVISAALLTQYEPTQWRLACVAAAALMLAGMFARSVKPLILIGGLIAYCAVFGYSLDAGRAPEWPYGAIPLAALVMGLGALMAKRTDHPIAARIWAIFAALLPIGMMLTSAQIANFTSSVDGVIEPFRVDPKLIALYLSLALAGNLGLAVIAKRSDGWKLGPTAFYLTGAAIAYTLAAVFAFDGWHLSLALMLGIVFAVAAYRGLPEEILKVIAVGFATLTAGHVLFHEIPIDANIGERIILNSLWFYLALPAAICAASAWALQRNSDRDIWAEFLKAFALTFAALFAVFQVRHLMNGGDVTATDFKFDEIAMQVLVGLCFTLGGMRLGRVKLDGKTPSLLSVLAMGISMLTLGVFVLSILLAHNPLINWETRINGGAVFNSLTLAYLLPSIALGAIAWLGRNTRHAVYVRLCGGLSLISFMVYIAGMIRHGFSGDEISVLKNWPGDLELYAISAAWLLLGILLLALGMKMKRRDVRLASAVVITLTVLKAFLVDMASLEGALRALSFVVLGVVLIVIGRVYQRVLFKGSSPVADPDTRNSDSLS